MFVRIPDSVVDSFLGKGNDHHAAEIQIQGLMRTAQRGQSRGILNGKIVHGKFRAYELQNGLEGTTWYEFDEADQAAWEMLAEEFEEATQALMTELKAALNNVNSEHEQRSLAPGMECHCEDCEKWRALEGIDPPKRE